MRPNDPSHTTKDKECSLLFASFSRVQFSFTLLFLFAASKKHILWLYRAYNHTTMKYDEIVSIQCKIIDNRIKYNDQDCHLSYTGAGRHSVSFIMMINHIRCSNFYLFIKVTFINDKQINPIHPFFAK